MNFVQKSLKLPSTRKSTSLASFVHCTIQAFLLYYAPKIAMLRVLSFAVANLSIATVPDDYFLIATLSNLHFLL